MLPLILLAGAIAGFSAADAPRVGVRPITVTGDTASHIDQKFHEQVQAALENSGAEHVMLEEGWAGDCTEGPCLADAMGEAELDYLMTVQVEIIERDYITTLVVTDAGGAQQSSSDAGCEICTPDEAAAKLGEATSEASSQLEASAPEPEGPEPEPAPAPVPAAAPMSDAQTMRYIGWGLTGGGVVLLTSGITMIALEEKPYGPRCSDSNTDTSGECEYRHKTVEGGTVLTVLGGLAAGAGAALLVVHREKKNARVALSPFGRGVRIEGSF